MRRNSLLPALELPLVKEPQTGRQERDDRRGFMDFRGEYRRRPRFVVVLQKRAILLW